ncbi:NUDIX domain-containing protein [Arthrobacter sp. SLBN-112]|jgi:ADP-ribose pyrophosphatase YjhB (NUDIX family)|uniref:NUDIX domain-containing protein n=1 Tax=Arthrobacter sp. SLBN-112 TaxID=2768452 RepID=UPI0027B5BCE1|nr:NUDIX domain-containing protein [Arthrobacter sp. SLBN-112]MDQ0799551.1 ADP-ribose pyrophosphatase YjhB (NUDIX family) [Arthrobacter sp. SLBN-112]
MSTTTLERTGSEKDGPAVCPPREVVAVIVEWRQRIALFRRSQSVGHERGLWHCITGYVEAGVSPQQQALAELEEEAGLSPLDLAAFQTGEQLLISDKAGNPWLVHTYTAVSKRRRLTINEEHDAYRWTIPAKVSRFSNRVPWLDTVLQSTLLDSGTKAT